MRTHELARVPQNHPLNAAPADSLWLEVCHSSEAWLFELGANDDIAIAVGSHSSAQIQIGQPGVAATHFHFEREGNTVVVVPGYRAGLRINSIKASGPTPLTEHTTIDFCGVSLDAKVHRKQPEDFCGHIGTRRASTPAEYLQALPGEHDATSVAVPATPAPPTVASFGTTAAPPARFRTEGLLPLGSVRLPPSAPALGPQGTVIVRVPRPAARTTPPVTSALPPDLLRTERIPVLAVAPREPISPVPPVRSVLQEAPTGTKTADFDVAAMASHFITPASGVAAPPAMPSPACMVPPQIDSSPPQVVPAAPTRPGPRAHAWLAAVGRSAQQRPLLVAATALAGSLVLALALVGVARIAGPSREGTRAEPRSHAAPPSTGEASAALAERLPVPKFPLTGAVPIPSASGGAAPLVAATHLSAGRYAEAKEAYAELAGLQPSNPAYAVVADVLTRQQSPSCQQKKPARGCPQVAP